MIVPKKFISLPAWVWYLGLFICMGVGGIAAWYYWPTVTAPKKESTTTASTEAPRQSSDSEILIVEPVPKKVNYAVTHQDVYHLPLAPANQLLLGTTIAKTGEAGFVGQALSDGLFLYLNAANSKSAKTKSLRISLNQRDDSGVIARALPHVYDLLSATPFFFSPTGEIVFEKIYMPLLAKKALSVLFPAVGMRGSIDQQAPVVWFRPPYSFEIEALIHYAVHTLKQTKIALFFEESSWGQEAKSAAETILKEKHAITPCASASYPPSTVIIQQAVATLKQARPQVVLCISSGRPTYNFIREALNQEMHAVTFLGLSRVAQVAPQLKTSRGVQLITASVVPNPFKSKLAIVQQYRKYMQQYLPNKGFSTSSLEGFIAGSLLGYFVNKPKPATTLAELLTRIVSVKRMVFKGLVLQYKKKTLSWSVWLNTGEQSDWYEYSNS